MLEKSRYCLVLAATIIIATTCLASPPPGYPANPSWDLDDPINIVETREYFTLIYNSSDLGIPFDPYSFTFTNPRPEMELVFLLPAIDILSALYADQIDPHGPDFYGIFDLMEDDPVVAAQFREYLTTGILTTDMVEQPDVAMSHIILAANASDCYERTGLDSLAVVDSRVESSGLTVGPCTEAGTGTNPDPIDPNSFDCDLDMLVQRSLFECMNNEGLYLADLTSNGRFDCEDFAVSKALWLLKHLQNDYPGMQVRIIAFFWQCAGKPVAGHAMPVVIIDGKFYLVDPYTSEVFGPFRTLQEAIDKGYDIYAPTCKNGITPQRRRDQNYPPLQLPDYWLPMW